MNERTNERTNERMNETKNTQRCARVALCFTATVLLTPPPIPPLTLFLFVALLPRHLSTKPANLFPISIPKPRNAASENEIWLFRCLLKIAWFSIECVKIKTKGVTLSNNSRRKQSMNQWELDANACNRLRARENACEQVTNSGLVLVLLLIGRENDASFLSNHRGKWSKTKTVQLKTALKITSKIVLLDNVQKLPSPRPTQGANVFGRIRNRTIDKVSAVKQEAKERTFVFVYIIFNNIITVLCFYCFVRWIILFGGSVRFHIMCVSFLWL